MKKISKRLFMISFCAILLSGCGKTDASPTETVKENSDTISSTEIKSEDTTEISELPIDDNTSNKVAGESKYTTESDYFYNQMNDDQKALYNQFKDESEKLYRGSSTIEELDCNGLVTIGYGDFDIGNLKEIDAKLVSQLFYLSNPKYFFLSEKAAFGNALVVSNGRYALELREECNSLDKICEYRDAIELKTDEVMIDICSIDDPLEKEMAIIDWITQNTSYDYDLYERTSASANSTVLSEKETKELSLSSFYGSTIIGCLMNGKGVCSSYAKTMQYLGNAAGLETIAVESNSHGDHIWNMVKLYDDWYCVDTTWLDNGSLITPVNSSLNKSYDTFKEVSFGNAGHVKDSDIESNGFKYPECVRDTVEGQSEFYTGIDGDYNIQNGILMEYTGNDANIEIPSSVVEFDIMFLYDNSKIKSFEVADDNQYYSAVDGVIFSKDLKILMRYPDMKEGEYIVPEGTTKISLGSFSNNQELTTVTLPESVTEIGDGAFYGCEKLESIRLSSSISELGRYVFTDCKNLTTIYYAGSEDMWNMIYTKNADIPENCIIIFEE